MVAARRAQIHKRIMSLKNGYKTRVGKRGLWLSTGERQRIAIARVFIRDLRIMIWDEATSALDAATEREIDTAVLELRKGRTTLIIAHRLNTIKTADWILVFDDGEITEQGTHEILLSKKGGIYSNLWDKKQK